MIRVHVTREADDGTGRVEDLGELRMLELGAPVATYRETAEGRGIMRDVRAALAALTPQALALVRWEARRSVRRRLPANPDSWLSRLRRGEIEH